MKLDYLDKEEYSSVRLLKMSDNNNDGLRLFIRKYSLCNASTELHRHEYIQINYISQGKTKHVINNQEFCIIKGDIFVIPPYIPHMIISPKN